MVRTPGQQRAITIGLGALVLVLLLIVVWGLARTTAPQPGALAAPTPTMTPLRPTPTPRLIITTPHVLAAWVEPVASGPCDSCYNPRIDFTANGPFDVILACNPQGVFAGSLPSIAFTLLDANGHVVDDVQHDCGDPNNTNTASFVVPERMPAGQYSLRVSFPGALPPSSVLVLDASPQAAN